MLLVAICALLFSACDSDRDSNPVLDQPTQFTLNTPALADQYVELTESGTVQLRWSQPNYGFPASTHYKVQVGEVQGDGTVKWDVDTLGHNAFLATEYTDCKADMPASEIAQALCTMDGVVEQDDYVDLGYRPIAFRLYASVSDAQGVEVTNSGIFSNAVTFNHLKGYCAVRSLGKLYLIGQPEGWLEPTATNADNIAPWTLMETSIGSNIYQGSFNIPAGQFQLRFYSALTGWDGGASVGSQADDNPVDITMTNNKYEGDVTAPGKGSWQISDWAGGYVTFTVNLNTNTITMEATGDAPAALPTGFIYLVGQPSGWAEPSEANSAAYEDYKLYEYDNSGIYTGTFDIAEGQFQFRFYTALSGWDGGASVGAQADDAPVDVTLTDGTYSGSAVAGKGSWSVAGWAGGKVKIEYNSKAGTVTFTQQ